MSNEAFIYEAIRTPRGKNKGGSLHGTKPLDLVVGLINELKVRFPDLDPKAIDDVVLGVVSPVGDQGAVISRTAAVTSGACEGPRTTLTSRVSPFSSTVVSSTTTAWISGGSLPLKMRFEYAA